MGGLFYFGVEKKTENAVHSSDEKCQNLSADKTNVIANQSKLKSAVLL